MIQEDITAVLRDDILGGWPTKAKWVDISNKKGMINLMGSYYRHPIIWSMNIDWKSHGTKGFD